MKKKKTLTGLTRRNVRKEWVVRECFSIRQKLQPECWCREIWTTDNVQVFNGGELSKNEAEYICKIHNFYRKKKVDSND
jgi:hypothetical protein